MTIQRNEAAIAVAGENAIVVHDASIVPGNDVTERNEAIRERMEMTRFYLEAPDAVFDYNEHARNTARKNWERNAESLRARGKEPPAPFDESEFPPQRHIKGATWSRLATLYDLDVLQTRPGEWIDDPAWPEHKAYDVEYVVSTKGRELGRSRQLCSFAEQQGSRKRWTDSAQVMGTAETRARSRAIAQALSWTVPFAFETATPEEMPAVASGTNSPQISDGFERPTRQSAHPDTGAHSPHLRGGQNVNPDYTGPIGNEPTQSQSQTATPSEGAAEAAAPPEQEKERNTPREAPDDGQNERPATPTSQAGSPAPADAVPVEDGKNDSRVYPMPSESERETHKVSASPFGWAHNMYLNCVAHKLLPALSSIQWQEVCPALMEASAATPEQQGAVLAKLRANPTEHAADPVQPWLFGFAVPTDG